MKYNKNNKKNIGFINYKSKSNLKTHSKNLLTKSNYNYYNNEVNLKSGINNIITKDKPKTNKVYYFQNFKNEQFDDNQSNLKGSTSRKKNSQNLMDIGGNDDDNYNNDNNNDNGNDNYNFNDFSFNNYSNFDNSSKNNQKEKILNVSNLNLKHINRFNTDKSTDNENELNNNKINNIKNNNKLYHKNNLVISLNNFITNDNSFFNTFQLNNKIERDSLKTNSTDKNNDFHNYLKMSSYFSSSHSKGKGSKYDTEINNGSQSDRLNNNNKFIFEEGRRKNNSISIRERVNNIKPNQSSNFEQLGDNYFYSNTINNFYNQKNLDSNNDTDDNIENDYYFVHKPKKSNDIFEETRNKKKILSLIDNSMDYIFPDQIERSIIKNKTIYTSINSNNISRKKNKTNRTSLNNSNYYPKNNYIREIEDTNLVSKTKKNDNRENNIKNSKHKKNMNINNKPPNKISVIKKNKNKNDLTKKKQTLKISSFEIPIYSSIKKNGKLNYNNKDGIFIIKMENGIPVYELEINDKNMNKVNHYLKEKRIELMKINEINELKQNNKYLENELKQMKENLLVYHKNNELLKKENKRLKMERK